MNYSDYFSNKLDAMVSPEKLNITVLSTRPGSDLKTIKFNMVTDQVGFDQLLEFFPNAYNVHCNGNEITVEVYDGDQP